MEGEYVTKGDIMKLYGSVLDQELLKRRQFREERISKRITAQLAAKQKGVGVLELMDYECGYDICPHDEYIDVVEGLFVKNTVRRCKKCGRIGGTEKYA